MFFPNRRLLGVYFIVYPEHRFLYLFLHLNQNDPCYNKVNKIERRNLAMSLPTFEQIQQELTKRSSFEEVVVQNGDVLLFLSKWTKVWYDSSFHPLIVFIFSN